jgi:hypothetical protein
MLEATERVEIADVVVLKDTDLVLYCRVGDEIVAVPSLRILPGTQIKHWGDRGPLVLPHDLAVDLGLA